MTFYTMLDLQLRHLTTAQSSAARQWAICQNSSNQESCDNSQEDCCLFNVNALLCVDLPGVDCGPFSDLGTYAKHAVAEKGYLSQRGEATFHFSMPVFWPRPHTVVMHASLGNLTWAFGTKIRVTPGKRLCKDEHVPGINGSCESCLPGWQPTDGKRPPQAVETMVSNEINPLCVPCQPGEHSTGGGYCVSCRPGRFQDAYGQSRCQLCPPGQTAPGFAARICSNCTTGRYSSQAGGRFCEQCPDGAACPEGKGPFLLPGYYLWQEIEPSLETSSFHGHFIPCRVQDACVGGEGNDTCREGMTGFLCDHCIPGWTKSDNGLCHQCSAFHVNMLWALLLVFIYSCYVTLMVWLKTAAGMGRAEVKSIIMKIVCNYLFLAGIAWRILPEGVSDRLRSVFGFLRQALLEPQTLVAVDCMMDPERGDMYNFVVVGIALVIIPLSCIAAWLLVFCSFIIFRVRLPKCAKGWLQTMTPIFLVIAFVIHPMITRIFIRFSVACVDIEGWRLEADLDLLCYQGTHMVMATLCFVGVLVWSLGLPLTFFIVLRHYRRRLMQHHVRQMFGFLYNGYEHRCYNFEVFFMLRKVVILLAVSMHYGNTQTVMLRLLVIAIVSLVVQCKVSPFDNRSWHLLDTLETANLVAFMITLLVALYTQAEQSQGLESFVGKIMIVGSHMAYMWFVLMALARPALVRVLNDYCDFLPSKIRHKICKYMHVAAGQIHAFPDGSLGITGLNKLERGYLGNMLGEALEELCSQKAITVLNQSRLRHMIKVAAASIFSRRAGCHTGTPTTPTTPEHILSLDGPGKSWGCCGKILSILRLHTKALRVHQTEVPHSPGRRLSVQAEEATIYLEDVKGDTFSLEELQEALMDVLDNICSGALIVDEIDNNSVPLTPDLRSNSLEDSTTSDFFNFMCSARDVHVNPIHRLRQKCHESACCSTSPHESTGSTTVEDFLRSSSSDLPAHREARTHQSSASIDSAGSDWRFRMDKGKASAIDEVLALIDIVTASLPAGNDLVEPREARNASNLIVEQPHQSRRQSQDRV